MHGVTKSPISSIEGLASLARNRSFSLSGGYSVGKCTIEESCGFKFGFKLGQVGVGRSTEIRVNWSWQRHFSDGSVS